MKDDEKKMKDEESCACGHHHDGECDCGCDHEDEGNILTLTDEDGNSHDYYELGVLEMDGAEYTVIQPVELDEDMSKDEVLIYRNIYDDDGEFVNYVLETDEAVSDKIIDEINRMIEEESLLGDDDDDGDPDDGDCGCGNDR